MLQNVKLLNAFLSNYKYLFMYESTLVRIDYIPKAGLMDNKLFRKKIRLDLAELNYALLWMHSFLNRYLE